MSHPTRSSLDDHGVVAPAAAAIVVAFGLRAATALEQRAPWVAARPKQARTPTPARASPVVGIDCEPFGHAAEAERRK